MTPDVQEQGDAPAAWEIARDEVLAELQRLAVERPAPLIVWTHPTWAGRDVFVGIALQGKAAGVFAVPRADWNGMAFLALAGIDMTPTKQAPDLERMRQERAALRRQKKTKETA